MPALTPEQRAQLAEDANYLRAYSSSYFQAIAERIGAALWATEPAGNHSESPNSSPSAEARAREIAEQVVDDYVADCISTDQAGGNPGRLSARIARAVEVHGAMQAAIERERCAEIAEEFQAAPTDPEQFDINSVSEDIAAAIRAGGAGG